MRRTTWPLVVAGSLFFVSGARAQDAVPAPRKDVVFAGGDRVHGSLRGGEAHVLKVRLAKGDVYSFKVAAADARQSLLLHLTIRDPQGREINADAHVRHQAQGKRVVLGPFRAPATGTYSLEILADGTYLNRGDYVGSSKLRMARANYVLPSSGAAAAVEVPAGATLRLRAKGALSKMSMALPGETATTFNADDPLVASLRAGGLASSTTGTFQFAAQGARAASVSVSRRNWKPLDVAAPTFAELSADQIPAGFAPPTTPVVADAPAAPHAASAPIAVDAPSVGKTGTASLFFTGASIGAAGPMAVHSMTGETNGISVAVPDPKSPTASSPPSDAIDPETPAPVAPGSGVPKSLGTSQTSHVHVMYSAWPPSPSSSGLFGVAAFTGYVGWHNGPWNTWAVARYPTSVSSKLLPVSVRVNSSTTVHGDDADPFALRTSEVGGPSLVRKETFSGTITTTTRYYVDGHQVAGVIAAGGDMEITWKVVGSGVVGTGATPWTLSGEWKSSMHSEGRDAWSMMTTNVVNGTERYAAGTVSETVEVIDYQLKPLAMAPYLFDPIGRIRNTLKASDIGLTQTFERSYKEATARYGIDRQVPAEVSLTTVDPTTPTEGVEDEDTFVFFLC